MNSFTPKDIRQIKDSGMNLRAVKSHLALYQHAANYFKLNRPCDVNDGILPLTPTLKNKLIKTYENEAGKYKLLKFVPASGAASRMFAEWFAAHEKGSFGSVELDRSFLLSLKEMPFYNLIEKENYGRQLLEEGNVCGLLDFILLPDGLNYGWLPKALIPFHRYSKKEIRTALEEHLYEAANYIFSTRGISCVHFTISAEHEKHVAREIRAVKTTIENLFNVKYKIRSSIQSPATHMLAADENNFPFRDNDGKLVFRPGGHGALLKNLNDLDADLIFVRNIDNIVNAKYLKKILPYKKILGGLALQIQQSVFAFLRELEKNNQKSNSLNKVESFCRRTLNIVFPPDYDQQSWMKKKQLIVSRLDRPLRICGMVRNEGEPGGGPFWVDEKDGTQTLQIVESGHVDEGNSGQVAFWSQAKYFNPVDMVCCIRNYRGQKFELNHYVNQEAYLISQKTEKGRRLKALELPGLWNGSMANWNTVFVELPLTVFNPVKTVYDLLRPGHQSLKTK